MSEHRNEAEERRSKDAAERTRPLPNPTKLSAPFWDGARRRELWVQRCTACGTHVFYPRYLCTECGSRELEWVKVSGRGTVFTYTVAHWPTHPSFAERVPYVIAVVELEEGPKLTTNLVGIDPTDVRIGLAVHATYDDVDDVTLVYFTPA